MNRARWAAVSSAVAAIVVAASLPGQAQTTTTQTTTTPTTTATTAADACLSRPGAAGPKGTHWYYRIERGSGRKCWYLGSADQKLRRADRKAVPTPAPRPVEEEEAEQAAPATPETTAQDMAAQDTAAQSSTPRDPATHNNAVAPASAASVPHTNDAAASGWPGTPDSGDAGNRDATAATGNDNAGTVTTAETEALPEQADMPLVWPAMTAEQANLAQPFESMPGVASLVIFLAAAGAFVAIAFRAVLQLWSGWFAGHLRNRPVAKTVATRAEPVIRPRRSPDVAPGATSPRDYAPARERSVPARERFASNESIEAMTEPTIARLREIAARWENPRHIPRAPRVAPLDEMQDAEHDAPPPPWRRNVMAQ
jgi:hypothetical protein